MKWTPTRSQYHAWTTVRIPYVHMSKTWCQQNYPDKGWWYCWMTGNFYFEDPSIAVEFSLRFGHLWANR